jgi:signal transduction histidine kinase
LVIADDGKGFPEVIGDGRFGLEGLRERTKQLGGSVYLENREGGGAKIRLQIPVDTYNGVG